MFDAYRADLSGMVDTKERIYVDHVSHRAIIEINEEHTVAAARSREFKKHSFPFLLIRKFFNQPVILN